jgi:hypothetical protein
VPPSFADTFAAVSSRAWPALEEGGGLTRQLGLVFGVGLLVLVATLGILLALVLRAPADGERRAAGDGVPVEGTLTILPGRFLVEEGDVDIELRLVKTGPTDREETTIGREPGPLYRHVRLLAPSVSAKHAKLVCDRGRYTIVNYSRTNPTRVNGEALSENASRRLVDGDRIEIGEGAMTYRENR